MDEQTRGDGLSRAESLFVAITRRIAFIGVVGMVVIGVLTTLDVVVLRAMLKSPIPGSNEFLNTIFAVAIASVLASGLAQRAVLDIDILSNRLGKTAASWLRACGSGILLLSLVLISWRVGVYSIDAYHKNLSTMILRWPMWPFLFAITLLFIVCLPVQFVSFLRTVREALLSANRTDPPPGGEASGYAPRIAPAAAAVLAGVLVVSVLFYFGIGLSLTFFSKHGTGLAIFMFFLLWAFILLLVPLAAAMVICGLMGAAALMGFPPALSVVGSETVGLITSADLAVIPLFLMMGGFATVGGMSADIFRLAHAMFGSFRGGLALATIGGCAGFGALTGSSLATVATIGAVALPEMRKRGYSLELSSGAIAAGGTLGQLVPPSTAIVVYALLVEQSIGRLYIAVLVPAFITVILYMLAVGVTLWLKPNSAPGRDRFDGRELFLAVKGCIWVVLMFGTVIGGIYTGVFTATEAAAVGAVIAFLVALCRGKLGKGALWEVVGETTRSTSMLYFLIIGAMVISFFMGTSGLPAYVTETLTGSGLSGLTIVVILVVIYFILGTIMDSFAIMIMTAPLVAPIIVSIGYDSVWWGIIMVVLVEMGVVTPPFGLNLFMIKSLVKELTLPVLYRGVTPFIVADAVKVVLLIAFPFLVLWLANTAFS
jgi:C4-dicarboxylate transporter, DctM subunit